MEAPETELLLLPLQSKLPGSHLRQVLTCLLCHLHGSSPDPLRRYQMHPFLQSSLQ